MLSPWEAGGRAALQGPLARPALEEHGKKPSDCRLTAWIQQLSFPHFL